MRTKPRFRSLLASLLVALVALTGCTSGSKSAATPKGADELATALAAALTTGSLDGVALAGDANAALIDYQQATAGLDQLRPTIAVGPITYSGFPMSDQATVQLDQTYQFEKGAWTFSSTAHLVHDDHWKLVWSPEVVHPSLTTGTRLTHDRTAARRGSITDRTGRAIVEYRPVYRVGINKPDTPAEKADSSARELAKLVGIDVDAYAARVAASGPQAFVQAIVLRQGQVPGQVASIPGAAAYPTQMPLGPSSTFAVSLLGTVAEASAEDVANGEGAIQAGDFVGQSGLQALHDKELRGTPGHSITLKPRTDAQRASAPPLSPSPSASQSPHIQASTGTEQILFSVAAVNGPTLQLTLDMDVQASLEDALSKLSGTVALVALDPKTGAIVAAGASPGAQGMPAATTGRYEPGSVLKVASALALLRRGMTADSIVQCTQTATVNGREFTNYPGYPTDKIGAIPLRTALLESCNTAFVNAHITNDELQDAAASLGIGVDYDSGFDSYYGTIPASADPVVTAANSFGQGETLVSPMALAGLAASVSSGSTQIPHLLASSAPVSTAKPLTPAETAGLQDMMSSVVSYGTGAHYAAWVQAAKTGTAEFWRDGGLGTHLWVAGWNSKYALAVMDYDNTSAAQLGPAMEPVKG